MCAQSCPTLCEPMDCSQLLCPVLDPHSTYQLCGPEQDYTLSLDILAYWLGWLDKHAKKKKKKQQVSVCPMELWTNQAYFLDRQKKYKPNNMFTPEKAMATHSSTLAWKIPWTEEPGRLHSPWGLEESDTTEWLHFHFSLSCIGEGNGNPLQYSCLENPRDRGA